MDGDATDPTNFVSSARAKSHRVQRAERGFSDEDWWNFDVYIAWVIANAVKKMKTDGNTSFIFKDEPEEKWEALTNEEYDVMIKGFGDYAQGAYSLDKESLVEIEKNLNAALEVFKKRFKSLWD